MNSTVLRKNAVVSPCIITSFAESYGVSRAAYDEALSNATQLVLGDFCSHWSLSGSKEGLHQLAFTTNSHSRKTFEPFAFRNLRFGVEPVGKRAKVIRRNLAPLDSIQ
jgi:hypothetical protein